MALDIGALQSGGLDIGALQNDGIITIIPTGIATEEALGEPRLAFVGYIQPNTIATAEALGSPKLLFAPLVLTSIPSAEAFGTLRIGRFIDFIGIPSAEAFGTLATVRNISFSTFGIASAEAHGQPTLLLHDATTGLIPTHTIFVGSGNANTYVRVGGVNVSRRSGSRSTATIRMVDVSGTYRPTLWSEVIVYTGYDRAFAGFVLEVEEGAYHANNAREFTLQCVDYGVLCDYRYLGMRYDTMVGGFVNNIIADIMSRALRGTGIYFDSSEWTPWTQTYEQLFNWVTVTEAFNRLMGIVNGDWWVDVWKQLHTFPKDVGFGPAPYEFNEADGRILVDNSGTIQVSVSRSGRQFANRVGVRNNLARRQTWIQTYTTTSNPTSTSPYVVSEPARSFTVLPFPIDAMPIVRVNGVEAVVVAQDPLGGGAWAAGDFDFYYSPGSYSFWANWKKAAPTGTITIEYPCPLSAINWQEDLTAGEGAMSGTWEYLEEVKDYPTEDSINALAAGLLLRRKTIPRTVSLKTRLNGFFPGQLLTLNLTKPPIVGDFLIESVNSKEVVGSKTKTFFMHDITAQDVAIKPVGSPNAYFGKLIERSRQGMERTMTHLCFNVAGTIRGLTNPGLEVGVAEGIRTAPKIGILRDVRLRFKSIDDGTLTTTEIKIDVYQNGASIFGVTKVVLPAGSVDQVIQWAFATSNPTVAEGDIFTYEVLTADPLATDGILEINILG